MQFKPKSEKEMAEESLISAGEYDFEVVQALDKRSRAGNEMIELKLCVFVGESRRFVFDYLLESMGFKLRHFFEGIGRLPDYIRGNIDAISLVGSSGKVELMVDEGKGNFGPKMAVKDYVVEGDKAKAPKATDFKNEVSKDDSEIPF